jgi:N-acetylglucosamine-6-phosphate deacetylase
MMPAPVAKAFVNARLFDGERFADGYALVVYGGKIAGIEASVPEGAGIVDLGGGILAPGFLDVQVNGGGGILLNSDPTAQGMARIAAAHRPFGTTGLLPTLITDTADRTEAVLAAALEARGAPGIIGLHLEGPHLDPRRKGAHRAEYMRPVSDADIAVYSTAAASLDALVLTLAACQVTLRQVAQLASAGVIVSIGHSECSADEADALFDAGARGVTHLFNAMTGLGHREPGLVGAALARDDVWAGIIADGHHVDPRALKVALAAKRGPGRIFLVTDAMALIGSDADHFLLNGRVVRRDDSAEIPRLTLEDGTLAGADIDMAASIRFLVERVGVPVDDALRRATADPADFLRLADSRGRLRPGARADLVHLDDDLAVRRTFMAEEL